MRVNSLPKTVTRQRRGCDFRAQALLQLSPARSVIEYGLPFLAAKYHVSTPANNANLQFSLLQPCSETRIFSKLCCRAHFLSVQCTKCRGLPSLHSIPELQYLVQSHVTVSFCTAVLLNNCVLCSLSLLGRSSQPCCTVDIASQ